MSYSVVFPKCWNCGSEELVSHQATAEEREAGTMPKDAVTYLTTEATLIGVSPISGMGKVIFVRYDVCARCGTRRCTRAERGVVPPKAPMVPPITFKPPMGNS